MGTFFGPPLPKGGAGRFRPPPGSVPYGKTVAFMVGNGIAKKLLAGG